MLAKRIRDLRNKENLSQAKLAKSLGVTQQAVAKWELGQNYPDHKMMHRVATRFGVSVDYLLGRTEEIEIGAYPRARQARIPIIGMVRAGYNALAYEEELDTEPADVPNPEEHFYFLVQGDSMEPYIRDGDLALVHRQPTLDNGDLGVVIYGDGEGTLKRFIHRGQEVILEPFNPDYETLTLSGEELDSLYIFGKVVETKTRW